MGGIQMRVFLLTVFISFTITLNDAETERCMNGLVNGFTQNGTMKFCAKKMTCVVSKHSNCNLKGKTCGSTEHCVVDSIHACKAQYGIVYQKLYECNDKEEFCAFDFTDKTTA